MYFLILCSPLLVLILSIDSLSSLTVFVPYLVSLSHLPVLVEDAIDPTAHLTAYAEDVIALIEDKSVHMSTV